MIMEQIYVEWSIDTMLEISLPEPDNFLKVKETLSRIGIASRQTDSPAEKRKLYQSCHILHKQGRYFIVHFKELFALDGKHTDLTLNDIERRNAIASLLEEWKLLKIVNRKNSEPRAPISQIKIVSFKDKGNWEMVSKYQIGRKRS